MKSVIFSFTTHNHQPLGNFDHVFEECYRRSYLPFFQLANKYPAFRFATHFTGILLDWIESHHPEHIALLRAMADCGQLEMISGGYYEPILSVIPPQDQQEQISRLTKKIEALFGQTAKGMWLAERVWEQPLASVLHTAGMQYVFLDDTHFISAGLRSDDLNGYYLTEDKGQTLAVFPISKALRYAIPFSSVDETIRVLRDASSESETNVVTFADDGEKFGSWPKTFEHVYKNGWLDEFFRKLTENAAWIDILPPGEAMKKAKPRGRIYLPNASYAEMMQWSLPTAEESQLYEDFLHELNQDKDHWQRYRQFVRGGYWRNFFVKYPESNQLHKHALRTSARCQKLHESGKDISEARTELLRSQCNDPYWHGVFGGIYLSNLRHANYSALVRADSLLDAAENLDGVRIEATDFDCDGADEVIIESRNLSLFVKPSLGGMIAEIDFKPRSFNATNIISRQKETYHAKIAQMTGEDASDQANEVESIHSRVETKEKGLEKLIIYDPYRHGCLIEHFLDFNTTLEDIRTMRFTECGNFVTSAFEWGWNRRENILKLTSLGAINMNGTVSQIRLTKELTISEENSDLKVTYSITNESPDNLRFRLASEWAFNLLAGAAHDRYYSSGGKKLESPQMNSSGSISKPQNLRLDDEYLKLAIDIRPDGAEEIIRFPIESVSMSEGGIERIYQGSIVLPVWNVEIASGIEWSATMTVVFDGL